MIVSIIIRTLNEEKYLNELLFSINNQKCDDFEIEIIVVDSGSTDNTLKIASDYGCNIKYIEKSNFSFGKSLNIGCEAASGEILVFISGHCIPLNEVWLKNLISPIVSNDVVLTYGRQIGNETSKFSEKKIFNKYFKEINIIPQNNIFCNNANSAILKKSWKKYRFDNDLTGLEDLDIAKKIINDKYQIGYVANSVVYHLHNENWNKIRTRYEREALALRQIMPEIHISFFDFLRYLFSSFYYDFTDAFNEKKHIKIFLEIIFFRTAQYWGSYKGNKLHKMVSKKTKEKYFYPK